MECVRCEVRAAKLKCVLWALCGWTYEDMAKKLGNKYYIENRKLWRVNTSPPYAKILIRDD